MATRCLGNERLRSSDEYCVKERNEEKRKQRNIMGRFMGVCGEAFPLFPSTSPFIPLFCSLSLFLSPTFAQKLDRNVFLAFVLYSRRLFGSLYLSGKLPTYPSPKPISTLTSQIGQNVGLGEEQVASFPETYNDPPVPGSQIVGKSQK